MFNEKIHDVLQHYTYDSSQVDSWKTDIVAACGDAVQGSGWRFQFECAIIPAAEELPAWSVPEAPEFDKEEDMLLVLENPSDTYKVRLTAIGKPEAPGAPPVQPSQPQQPPRPVQAGEVVRACCIYASALKSAVAVRRSRGSCGTVMKSRQRNSKQQYPSRHAACRDRQADRLTAANTCRHVQRHVALNLLCQAHAAAFEPATGPVTTAEARTEQPAATATQLHMVGGGCVVSRCIMNRR